MSKLWSAATVKIYGGGVSEVEFLEQLSRLIGDFDLQSTSVSYSQGPNGGRSTSRSVRRERILDVADLSALPKGRVIVVGSGARPALARTLPWMQGPYAQLIRESIARHDPGSTPSPGSVRASATRSKVPKRESTRSSRSKGRRR